MRCVILLHGVLPSSRSGSVLSVVRTGRRPVRLHPQLQWLLHRAGRQQHGGGVPETAEWDHRRLWRGEARIFFFWLEMSKNCCCLFIWICVFAAHGQGVLQRHRENQNHRQHVHGSCGPRPHHWHQGDRTSSVCKCRSGCSASSGRNSIRFYALECDVFMIIDIQIFL